MEKYLRFKLYPLPLLNLSLQMFVDSLLLSGMTNKKNLWAAALILFIIFGCLGCGKEDSIQGLKLQVSFLDGMLFDDLMAEVKFTWTADKNFLLLGQKARVFVLMWHGKNLLSQDYHVPEVHPSEWKPGGVYSYSRRLYIPEFIDQSDPDFKGGESLELSAGFWKHLRMNHPAKLLGFQRKCIT